MNCQWYLCQQDAEPIHIVGARIFLCRKHLKKVVLYLERTEPCGVPIQARGQFSVRDRNRRTNGNSRKEETLSADPQGRASKDRLE